MAKTKHETYLRKMAIEMIAYMKKQLKNKKEIKKYLLEFLAENMAEQWTDDWWNFVQDVIMDGYERKGLSKMTVEELSGEYIEFITGAMINKRNYDGVLNEAKDHFDMLFEDDGTGYSDHDDMDDGW